MGNAPNVWKMWDKFPDFASLGELPQMLEKLGNRVPEFRIFFSGRSSHFADFGNNPQTFAGFLRNPKILELLSKTPEFWKYWGRSANFGHSGEIFEFRICWEKVCTFWGDVWEIRKSWIFWEICKF